MKVFRGLCSLVLHLYPWNLHCMFNWFLSSLHNMDGAVTFLIASLCCIKNEDLEKLCWISLLCSISSEDIEKLNTFSHPQPVREQGEWLKPINEGWRTESKSFSLWASTLPQKLFFLSCLQPDSDVQDESAKLILSSPEPVSSLMKWDYTVLW